MFDELEYLKIRHETICSLLSLPNTEKSNDKTITPSEVMEILMDKHSRYKDHHREIQDLLKITAIVNDTQLYAEDKNSIINSVIMVLGLVLYESFDLSIFPILLDESLIRKIPFNRILDHLSNEFGAVEVGQMIHKTLVSTIEVFKSTQLTDNYMPLLECFHILAKSPVGAKILTESDLWNRKKDSSITDTLLGALLSISGFSNDHIIKLYFADPTLTVNQMDYGVKQVRDSFHIYLDKVHTIIMDIIKYDRKVIQKWIIENLFDDPSYRARSGMYHQMEWETKLNLQQQDGFHINFCIILMKICKPFVDTFIRKDKLSEKLNLIDYTFYSQNSKAFFNDNETMCLLKDSEQVPAITESKEFGFVSSIFFITHLHMYKAFISGYSKYGAFCVKYMNSRRRAMEDTSPEKEELLRNSNALFSLRLSMDCYFADPRFNQDAIDFYTFTCYWIYQIMETPEKLNYIPEFMITNISKCLVDVLITLYSQTFKDTISFDPIFTKFLLKLLGQDIKFKNPHIKSKALEALMYFSCPHIILENVYTENVTKKLNIEDPIINDESKRSLIPNLIRFYIDVEFSDSPNNYYQKYITRDLISRMLRHLKSIPQFKHSFEQFSHSDLFLEFMRRLISDATYHMDELVEKLPKIKNIEKEKSDIENWNSMSKEYKAEKEEEYSKLESSVSVFARYANESISLLHFFSKFDVNQLKSDEITERIAPILNYFLWYFAGPNRNDLKIDKRDKIQFKPRLILSILVEMYIRFHKISKIFGGEVVKDGRFKIHTFEEAGRIIKSNNICQESVIEEFNVLIKELKTLSDSMDEEIPSNEIPEEFLDPLMFTLMEDPVTLPSGLNMDRQIITRHLESNSTDPFNRKHLTADQLKTNDDLRNKIKDWVAEWKKNRNK